MKNELDKLNIILNSLIDYSGVSMEDTKSSCRKREMVEQRQRFCYLARSLTTISLSEIGKALGDRDHTTVIHSYNQELARIRLYSTEADLIAELIKKTGISIAEEKDELEEITSSMGMSDSTFTAIIKKTWQSGFEAGKRFMKAQEKTTYKKKDFIVDKEDDPPPKKERPPTQYSNMRLYDELN